MTSDLTPTTKELLTTLNRIGFVRHINATTIMSAKNTERAEYMRRARLRKHATRGAPQVERVFAQLFFAEIRAIGNWIKMYNILSRLCQLIF